MDHWKLTIVKRSSKTWSKAGYKGYRPSLYVDGYRISDSKGTYHEDIYFKKFISQYLDGACIDDAFSEWRFGYPTGTSVQKNLMRYRNPIIPPHKRKWRMAVEFAMKHFSMMNNSRINWDFDVCKQFVNPAKSPGFPYNRPYDGRPGFAKKRDYLSYQGGEPARKDYEAYLERISKLNYKPTSFCVASGKKELRKVSKIKADEFRAYLASNDDNTLAGIGATGEMNEKFYRSWPTSCSFVGGSFFSGAWDQMMKRLSVHPHAFEMDVSAWDSTLSREMIESFCEVMWSFVYFEDKTELNRIRFQNLFREIWQTLVLCPDGSLFLKNQGNPSGSFLTIVTNTIIHYMLFGYAWIVLNPDGENTTYDLFSNSVELALCGDDSLGTVEEDVFLWFNPKSIAQVWRSLGINLKDSAVSDGALIDRQFLSQRSRLMRGRYIPFPDHNKAVSTMIWKTRAHQSIKWSYLKACAMRIYTFNNLDSNRLFSSYINYLETDPKLGQMLRASKTDVNGDILSWEIVHTVYKTDEQIMSLYLPQFESQQIENSARVGLEFAEAIWDESVEPETIW